MGDAEVPPICYRGKGLCGRIASEIGPVRSRFGCLPNLRQVLHFGRDQWALNIPQIAAHDKTCNQQYQRGNPNWHRQFKRLVSRSPLNEGSGNNNKQPDSQCGNRVGRFSHFAVRIGRCLRERNILASIGQTL